MCTLMSFDLPESPDTAPGSFSSVVMEGMVERSMVGGTVCLLMVSELGEE